MQTFGLKVLYLIINRMKIIIYFIHINQFVFSNRTLIIRIMENLLIQKSEKTPQIEFNSSGELRISGRSIPENPTAFFSPALTWLNNFERTHPKELIMHVNLEYFNTSSSKVMLNMFKQLEHMFAMGVDAKIYWYHAEDDEDIAEAGRSYEFLCKVPFRFVEMV